MCLCWAAVPLHGQLAQGYSLWKEHSWDFPAPCYSLATVESPGALGNLQNSQQLFLSALEVFWCLQDNRQVLSSTAGSAAEGCGSLWKQKRLPSLGQTSSNLCFEGEAASMERRGKVPETLGFPPELT